MKPFLIPKQRALLTVAAMHCRLEEHSTCFSERSFYHSYVLSLFSEQDKITE